MSEPIKPDTSRRLSRRHLLWGGAAAAGVGAATAAGVFGAPFFIIDGEPFWGNDRQAQIEQWLSSGPFKGMVG